MSLWGHNKSVVLITGALKIMQDGKYDISIIRPQLTDDEVKPRGEGFSEERLQAIKKGLHALHTLELMAKTIYKFQITKESNQLNRRLITAMCNEMTHYQDFQVKLYEYGFRPSIFRAAYWFVGFIFGYGSRLMGKRTVLKIGIWVETKAVHHYSQLLETIDWDDDTRKIIEKDQADEHGHIEHWKELLEKNS
jgi:ubiquinone biosynthesis monooxygenase Coq7